MLDQEALNELAGWVDQAAADASKLTDSGSGALGDRALPGTVRKQRETSAEWRLHQALLNVDYLENRLRLQEDVRAGFQELDTLHKGEADRARKRLAECERELALLYAALERGDGGETGRELAALKIEAVKRFLEKPTTLEEHNKYPNGRFRS